MLQEAEREDQTVSKVCRAYGIAEVTFYRWRKNYEGMTVSDIQRLREQERKNARLEWLLAKRDRELDAARELLAKKR